MSLLQRWRELAIEFCEVTDPAEDICDLASAILLTFTALLFGLAVIGMIGE